MGKGKRKKKAKQNSNLNSTQNINVVLPNSISNEEMQHIIANAIIESENIRKAKAKEQKEKELKEWHETIGYKEDYTGLNRILNDFKVFCKILFLKEKDIDGVTASALLLKMLLCFFFKIIYWCLTVVSVLLVAFVPLQFVMDNITPIPLYLDIICLVVSFVVFLLSRLFRMASIEIEKVENYNFLFGLFASITSIISIVIAVVAIVKGS